MVRKLTTLLPLIYLLSTGTAHALGLGELTLKSSLNQPLVAEIELLEEESLTPGEVLPTLAANEDFQRAGVQRLFFLSNIQFKVVEKEFSQMVIELTTRQAVKEPFLNFLVEINWPAGRLLREYTVLLDPPVYDETTIFESEVFEHSSTTSVTIEEPPSTTTSTVSSAASVSADTSTETTSAQPATRNEVLGENEYRVKRNDTLWEIALRYRPENSVSAQQMMLAIQDRNPEAFMNGNINRLKAGSLLQIPTQGDIQARSFDQAVDEVKRQNRALTNPEEVTNVPISASSGTTSALSDGTDSDADGRLELVAPGSQDSNVTASGDTNERVSSLENELALSLELNDKFERERDELQSRITDLEEQIEIMQRLLEAQSETGAALQNLDDLTSDDDDTTMGSMDSGTDSGTDDSMGSMDSDDTSMGSDDTSMGMDDSTDMTSTMPDTTPDTTATTTPTQPTPIQPIPQPKQGLVATAMGWIMASPINMAVAGLGVLLIVLLPVYALSKRKGNDEDIDEEEGVIDLTQDEMDDDGLTALDDDFESDDLDSMDLTDDLEADDTSASDSQEEADAVAEADIYIAYGRYDQAEDLLKKAVQQDPSRDDVKLKLAEVYAETGNADGFKSMAQQLASAGPITSSKLDELKAKLPGLDAAPEPEPVSAPTLEEEPSLNDLSDELSNDLSFDEPSEVPTLDMGDDDLSLDAGDLDLGADDLDLGTDDLDLGGDDLTLDFDGGDDFSTASEPEAAAAPESDSGLDFELGDLSLDSDTQGDTTPATDDGGDDLDFNLDDLSLDVSNDAPATATSESDDLDFSLDIGGDSDDMELPDLDLDLAPETDAAPSLDDPLSALDAQIEKLSEPELPDLELPGGDDDSSDLDLGLDTPDLSALDSGLDSGLDVGLDSFDASSEPSPSTESDDLDLDLDLSSADASEPEVPTGIADDEPLDLGLDTDFGGDLDLTESTDTATATAVETSEDDDFDFLAGSDETSTKLDLARAYIDMDDKEGAKDILEEVVQEGNDDQKAKAQELLQQMA